MMISRKSTAAVQSATAGAELVQQEQRQPVKEEATLIIASCSEARDVGFGRSACGLAWEPSSRRKCESAHRWPFSCLTTEPVSKTKLALGCAFVPGDHS